MKTAKEAQTASRGKALPKQVLFGEKDISSVYFFFDPDYSKLSLGTFSALYEIDWMRKRGMRYYYLGLFVESCAHLNYKANTVSRLLGCGPFFLLVS